MLPLSYLKFRICQSSLDESEISRWSIGLKHLIDIYFRNRDSGVLSTIILGKNMAELRRLPFAGAIVIPQK